MHLFLLERKRVGMGRKGVKCQEAGSVTAGKMVASKSYDLSSVPGAHWKAERKKSTSQTCPLIVYPRSWTQQIKNSTQLL